MAQLFKPFDKDQDTIYCFSDLVSILLELYKEDAKELNPEFASIFAKGMDCEMKALEHGYNIISRLNRREFRDLLKFMIVERLLREDTLPTNYYPLILEATVKVKNIPKYDIDFLVDQVSLRMMNNNDEHMEEFSYLCDSYQFWCNFRDALAGTHDVETEMMTMMCPINTYLYRHIGEGSVEEINRILGMVNEAESKGAVLKGFRMTFKTFVRNWIMADKVPEDFDLDSIDCAEEEPRYAKFEYNTEEIAEDIVLSNNPVQNIDAATLFAKIDILETVSVKNENIKTKVYKCKTPFIEEFVAIKEVIAPTEEDLRPFRHEAEVYQKLSGTSKNFLTYYNQNLTVIQIGNAQKFKFELMMEFVEKSLKDDKNDRMHINKPYSEDEIKHIYDQLIESFNIMRQKNILHCDIKPSNILVTSDLTIKIIDFNIARTIIHETTQAVGGAFGTLDFMAPEIRIGKEKDSNASLKEDKADVFSLGMTILYLLLDKPEGNLNLYENMNRLKALIENIRYTWLKNILKKMLEFDYRARASLQNLISAHVMEKHNRSITVDV